MQDTDLKQTKKCCLDIIKSWTLTLCSSRTHLQVRTFLSCFPTHIEFVLLSCFSFHIHIYMFPLSTHIMFSPNFFIFLVLGFLVEQRNTTVVGSNTSCIYTSARNQKQKKHKQVLQHHHLYETTLTLYNNFFFLLFIFIFHLLQMKKPCSPRFMFPIFTHVSDCS